MADELTGRCHCGAVGLKLQSGPTLVVSCHCEECKKRNGSVFSTYLAVPEQDLVITRGSESLSRYEIPEQGIKYFCSHCGSPVYNKNYRFPGLYMVFYGVMDQAEQFAPGYNVFCESKHDWVDSIANMPGFETVIER